MNISFFRKFALKVYSDPNEWITGRFLNPNNVEVVFCYTLWHSQKKLSTTQIGDFEIAEQTWMFSHKTNLKGSKRAPISNNCRQAPVRIFVLFWHIL